MLNYAETARSSTIVPSVAASRSARPERNPKPLSTMPSQQTSPDWSIDEAFGCLRYKGKHGEVHIPGAIWMHCDAAFAQGFWRGRASMLEHEDGDWFILTDQEFTQLIAQRLPAALPAVAIDSWKQGFIFGWCMTWNYQPFLNEEAEAAEEEVTLAAPATSRKRSKGTHSSAPGYPNALRSCIKQAGYTFREVSRETAIPESTLYSWASGKSVIPHASREQLADVIGCAVEKLAPASLVD